MRTEPERLYTTEDAAAELNVKSGTIRSWKSLGKVTPRDWIPGRGRGGVVPLYSLEDLRPLAARYAPREKADTP